MKLSKKFQEFIYSISTNDKYSEFDSRKSFNRINKPESEENLLYSHHNQSVTGFGGGSFGLENEHQFSQQIDGVHEVRLAWRHIKNWLTKYSPDLNSSLSSPCTVSDLNDFQKDLGVKLPNCLIEFFKLTDGQSNFNDNGSGGLIFGLKLMSIDEIVVMTENWRKVAKNLNNELSQIKLNNKLQELKKLQLSHNQNQLNQSTSENKSPPTPISPLGSHPYSGPTSSASSLDLGHRSSLLTNHSENHNVNHIRSSIDSNNSSFPNLKHSPSSSSASNHIPQQRSIPPDCIHSTYAHPMWIPIITDQTGNCIGLDLSPPTTGNGKWGQVILFGRDFDTKYLIADNFGDFLLIFANDLEMGNWSIKKWNENDGDDMFGSEGELIFINKVINDNNNHKSNDNGEELSYLEVLKNRSIKNWLNKLNDDSKQNDDIKILIKDLKNNLNNLNDLDSINLNSIDDYINSNLTNIDDLNKSELPLKNHSRKLSVPSVKSPLSNEVVNKETNLDNNLLDNIIEDEDSGNELHDELDNDHDSKKYLTRI